MNILRVMAGHSSSKMRVNALILTESESRGSVTPRIKYWRRFIDQHLRGWGWIHAATAEILQHPDVVKVLEARSFRVDNVGPDGFATMIAAETEKWAKVIRAANIKGD